MKSAIIIFTVPALMVFQLRAQVMSVTIESGPAKENFMEGRDIFHMAWFEEASIYPKQALEHDSTLAIAHIYLVVAKFFQFHNPSPYIEAARAYSGGVSVDEKWLIEGWSAFMSGDYMKTTRFMDSFVDEYPEDDYAAHIRGFSGFDGGDPAGAVELLSVLTERENPFTPALNHLAYAYSAQKKYDLAIKVIDDSIRSAPYNLSAYDSKAHLFYDQDLYIKSRMKYLHIKLKDPGGAERIQEEIYQWKGTPDLRYAMAISNLN